MTWVFGLLLSMTAQASGGGGALPATFVQIPTSCLGKVYPCALQAESSSILESAGGEIVLAPGSQLLLISKNELQLVRGQLWGRDLQKQSLRFGRLRFEVQGDVLFQRQQDRVVVRRLKGDLRLSGPTDVTEIPEGFENWYEGFNQRLQLVAGVPRAIEAESFARSWGQTLGRMALEPERREILGSYKILQRQAVAAESEVYHKAFENRRLAAEAEEQQRLVKLEEAAAESRRFRQMFRQKFYAPDTQRD